MDALRYWLALVMVVSLPPALLLWVVIHPLIGFWRRVGPVGTYVCVLTLFGLAIAGLVALRDPLMAVDFGTRWPLVALGALLVGFSSWLRLRIQRVFPTSTLAGLPELAPDRHPQALVTEGPFGVVRHPRYMQFMIALLGFSLICNHLVLYGVFALWLPGVWLIAVLEERELHDRFGPGYADYCRRVPRFLPRL
ncbi:MAG: isoprenylcysteine carboxylmethyltransferase family protein [Myxococcota bacterium]|nr:isoprenylcysteine carboxylmethyltransferase family protein [Myxococcota bacterium]